MARKLVIGVGGTGLDVLRCLRRRIVEDYPEQGLRQFPLLGFLYIDTDENAVRISDDNRKRWEVMGRSIQLGPSEHIIIQAPAIGRILENLPNFPQVRDWLPVHQLKGMDAAAKDTPGAQQIRALGRMIFTLESDRVRQRVASILDTLPPDPQDGKTEIHVACSLSGGTGGGMFLDLAYSLRRWTHDRAETTGYLVMPDLNQEADRGRRYIARLYGALLDLNYFSVRERHVGGKRTPTRFHLPVEGVDVVDQNPFDFCYLVGTRNQEGVALALTAVPDMISHRLYLTLDNAIVADVAAMMNNGAMQRGRFLYDPKNRNVFAQSFSTFGLSTIQYPTEQIVEIVSHRLAEAVVASWADASVVDNVNERVQQRLPDLSLIDDVFLGNRDIFQGANDFGSIANDVERQLNEALAKLPNDNRASEINRIFGNFTEEFRGGVKQFYRMREDNLEGAVQLLTRKVRAYAVDSIMEPGLGLPFAIASVDEVVRLLTQKQQELSLRREQLGPKVKNSRPAVTAAIGQITNAENTLLWRESKLKEAMTKMKATLAFNLTGQIEERALEYGVKLVGKLVQTLGTMRTELGEWASAMRVVRELLSREVQRRAESLEAMQRSSSQFNGAVLFKAERVEQVYQSLNEREALQYIRDHLARKGDVLTLGRRLEETVEVLYRIAGDWLTGVSSVRVAHKNVADQLLEDYPGGENAERRRLIADTYRQSAVFLEFDQGEVGIYHGEEGHGYEFDRTTVTQRAGMMDHEQNRFPSVALVRGEIGAATGLSPEAVRVVSDLHQIIFISERTAFPLRLIRDVRTLREKYRAHSAQKGALPLLLQRDYDPPMGDLMLVTQAEQEQVWRAEANFLIAWTLGWIRIELHKQDNRHEARYRFFENGADQYVRVGPDREEAFEYFTRDALDTAAVRKRLADAADQYVAKLDDFSKRRQFGAALSALLGQLKSDIPYGEDSELYQRYSRIRQYIVRELHLPERMDVGAQGDQTADAAADAPFAKYVDMFARQAKGKLTDKMLALIKTRQQELRIGDERAAAIVRDAVTRFAPPPDPLAEYRELLTALLEAGELTEDSVIELVGFQTTHGIETEQAERIEGEVRSRLGRIH